MAMGGGCLPLPSTLPFVNFRAKTVGLKNFFMDRCPMDEPTAINLACKKSSFQSREKLEEPLHPH